MADKQLTVAELLARAEKENPEAARRPRRRRSLEDGGVSVAELTDSFKKVDVKPAEVKHSSVPIDAPSDTPAPAKPEATEPEASKVEAPKPEAPKPEPAKVEAPKPAASTSVKLRPAAKPAPAPAPAPEPEPAPKAQPSSDETTVLRKVEAEPVVKQAPAQPDDTNEIRAVAAPEPEPSVEPAEEYEPVEDIEVEEASVNPILLVLLVFFGVLLGVLGFLAFKWLWANAATVVAVLVGIAAVAAVVAAVGAMAAGRDKVTMVIAGLAAAVVAFGPSLL